MRLRSVGSLPPPLHSGQVHGAHAVDGVRGGGVALGFRGAPPVGVVLMMHWLGRGPTAGGGCRSYCRQLDWDRDEQHSVCANVKSQGAARHHVRPPSMCNAGLQEWHGCLGRTAFLASTPPSCRLTHRQPFSMVQPSPGLEIASAVDSLPPYASTAPRGLG